MTRTGSEPSLPAEAWELQDRQHGVVARGQLLALGMSRHAISHRVQSGRLHLVTRGIYAVGRPALTREGHWMTAVLSCGPSAVLSHESAAALWGIRERERRTIQVTAPPNRSHRRPGVTAYRRLLDPAERTIHRAIPVTAVHRTLLDLAQTSAPAALEAAINSADKHDLTDPERLRAAIEEYAGHPGVRGLRMVLDRRTFALTDSELERRFLPIARRAGLPLPRTAVRLNGFTVDFHWPDLGLVVETDGLRYHRTPAAQARDRLRDQAHTAAGLTPLRFTHAQVRYEPRHVEATLAAVARRLKRD